MSGGQGCLRTKAGSSPSAAPCLKSGPQGCQVRVCTRVAKHHRPFVGQAALKKKGAPPCVNVCPAKIFWAVSMALENKENGVNTVTRL